MVLIWITGLSGSGKTTIGKILRTQLCEQGKKPIFLDGDELREVLGVNGQVKLSHMVEQN